MVSSSCLRGDKLRKATYWTSKIGASADIAGRFHIPQRLTSGAGTGTLGATWRLIWLSERSSCWSCAGLGACPTRRKPSSTALRLPGTGVEPERPLLCIPEAEALPPTEEGAPTPPGDADPAPPTDDPLLPDEELEPPDEPPAARARSIDPHTIVAMMSTAA